MAGGMGVQKNSFIEAWASRRENLEHHFKYSRGNWARLIVFGFGVPIAIYVMATKEMVSEIVLSFRGEKNICVSTTPVIDVLTRSNNSSVNCVM